MLVALGACLGLAAPAPASALTVEDLAGPLAPADLATSLAGPGVAVSNVTYSGADQAGGRFGDGTAAIGFDTGILLSSGDVKKVVPPNTADNTSTTNGTPGDPALSILSGFNTFDAVILEFDFVPQAARVEFKYVFTSEEYNEFANGSVNDVFAFFVNNANCAVVPGTSQAVSINTVNGGNPFGTNAVNPQFFRNNDIDDGGGSIPTQMDGLTTVFTCSAAVNAGQQNRMRLGIADGGDSAYDANVFLQAGSLVSAACNDGVDNDSDGQTDFPADTGCTDAADADEGGGTGAKKLSDLPPPEIGTTANVAPVRGEVFVSVPPTGAGARAAQVKGREFVPLSEAQTIPVGSLLDTKSGTVRIQTEAATADQLQAGNFFGGVFQLLQNRSGRTRGQTKLTLKGSSFSSCNRGATVRGGQATAAQRRRVSRRTIRKLSGNANGSYQTRGRHGAATVRGTIWSIADRCDGTLTRVRRGRVVVRDFRRKRNIVLRAGKSYLATPFASAR